MSQQDRSTPGPQQDLSAVEWLAAAAADPAALVRRWERDPLDVALLPVGRLWDMVLVAGAAGLSVLDRLTARGARTGPVLADTTGTRVGFLTPAGTSCAPFGSRARVIGSGAWLVVPHPEVTSRGSRWLVPPDGSGALTTPGLLAEAMAGARV
ncbi:hypothetical protein [Streptomyces indicus]|uniref:Bifunctional DNA primase/polymerase, N-terminal n=1 Tax=Streptomyces indicus TaxID=417292 RepID=A0A1G9AVT9_9ACTN|nr:hypothetical protein [Streptomyces indicus]SDK31411.1 hypothetical protein SAMN05421806_106182 [Streptomyces indicus]